MEYQPVSPENKTEVIAWLESLVKVLDGKEQFENMNDVFQSPEGDVSTGKDLVGGMLALLKNETITIK